MKSKRVSPERLSEPRATLLRLQNPQDLAREVQQVRLAIARRAYELFEARGREHGHDWEDWLRAEAELLRPVSVSMWESEDRISVRANTLGFEENDLRVSIEPRRITILGEGGNTTETEGGKVEYIDWCPDQILQFIDLTAEVMPEGAVVDLQAGLLMFDLPKATKAKVETASAAA
jgi:HSP20 family protein